MAASSLAKQLEAIRGSSSTAAASSSGKAISLVCTSSSLSHTSICPLIILPLAIQATRRGGQQRPSLLFDSKKAADVDIYTIHNMAITGLDELCEHDPRFEEFRQVMRTMMP